MDSAPALNLVNYLQGQFYQFARTSCHRAWPRDMEGL